MTDTPEHTPEEIEEAREAIEDLGHMSGLVEAQVIGSEKERLEALAAGDTKAAGAALGEGIKWAQLLGWIAAIAVVIAIAFMIFGNVGGGDSTAGDETDSPAANESGDEAAGASGEELFGTWRIFLDDTESTPIYDIPFGSGGPVAVVYEDALPWSVTSWDYTLDGDDVTVSLQCQIQAGDGTLIDWPEKLVMKLEGSEMRGTYSGEQWEYSPDDDTPEVERLGWDVNTLEAFGRPVD